MNDYEEPFEEETPTHSDVTSEEEDEVVESVASSSSAAAERSASDEDPSSDGSSPVSGRGSQRNSQDGKPAHAAVAVAALPVPLPVPAPVPLAQMPSMVPVHPPQPVEMLEEASESNSTSDSETDGRSSSQSTSSEKEADWRPTKDPGSGRTYYYNTRTRETTWETPAALRRRAAVPPVPAATTPPEPISNSGTHTEGSEEKEDERPSVSQPFGVRSSATEEKRLSGGERKGTQDSDATPSASMSVLTGVAGERQRAARAASTKDEFQRLNRYVAFGSGSSPSTMTEADRASYQGMFPSSDANAPLTVGDLLADNHPKPLPLPSAGAPVSEGEQGAEDDTSHSRLRISSTMKVLPSSGGQEKEKSSTGEDDPSSVFSTISQHLKPRDNTAAAAPVGGTARVMPATTAAAVEPFSAPAPSTQASVPATSVPLPTTSSQPQQPQRQQPPPTTAAGSVPQVKITMPSLPPPSFAPSADATSAFPTAPAPTGSHSTALPPPLPPASAKGFMYSPVAVATPVDPKLAELRETSEAVERLVRAFATLRGHAPANAAASPPPSFSPESSAKQGLDATTMHRVGAASTVRPSIEGPAGSASTARRRTAPTPTARPLSADEKASVAANEQLMEEVLLSCVLEMLQTDLSNTHKMQRIVDRVKAKPAHLTVSAEDFHGEAVGRRASDVTPPPSRSWGLSASSHARGGLSVFDGELRAFDGGATADATASAAETLYHSVQDSLQKYVLSHVVDATQPQHQSAWRPPMPSHGGGAVPTPVTPHFAWLLLLDLLAVCTDIIERVFVAAADDGVASLPKTPIIVRYEGERHCELLARNAIHCLPFEVIETPTGEDEGGHGGGRPSRGHRRPLFRLEFWVTRAAMFTVVDAVTATLREHIVHMANTAPYGIFATDINPYVNARVLAPTKVPMFSVVLDRHERGRGASEQAEVTLSGAHPRKPRGNDRSTAHKSSASVEEAFFGVGEASLESLAYSVSVVATDLLEKQQAAPPSVGRQTPSATAKNKTATGIAHPDAYADFTKAVTETMRELLDDAGIRAAVERRSLEKFKAAQQARQEFVGKDRMERERVVIQRAEKEADELVRKIAQEMLLHEAGV